MCLPGTVNCAVNKFRDLKVNKIYDEEEEDEEKTFTLRGEGMKVNIQIEWVWLFDTQAYLCVLCGVSKFENS